MDLARDGIALYESDDRKLRTPVPKTAAQALLIVADDCQIVRHRKSGFARGAHHRHRQRI